MTTDPHHFTQSETEHLRRLEDARRGGFPTESRKEDEENQDQDDEKEAPDDKSDDRRTL